MAKQRAATATPRLRFPEFRNADSWELRKLSDLLVEQRERNKNLKFGPEEVLSVSGEHGCVNQIKLLGRSYAGASVENYHVVETGDIVYTKSPLKKNPYGIIKENKGKPGIVSTLYAVYRSTDQGHPPFLDHFFSGDYNLNSYLQPIVRKGAKNDMKVNNVAVLGGDIFAPKPVEQKKIADCLTSLDEVIVTQGRKVTALKSHKRGLMQQLFPQEGETRPRLRFPEFRNAKEWEEANLGALSESVSSGRDKADAHGAFDLYGSTGIIGKTSAASFCGKFILVARVGANAGLLTIANGSFGVTDNTIAIILKHTQITDFIFHHLDSIGLNKLVFGSGQPLITGGQLKELVLRVPHAREQQRIADCLSSLDALITAEAAQLAALKTHKQGLMQQLFPAPERNS